MADAEVERALGGLEARTGILETRFAVMETRIDQRLENIDKRVAAVHDVVTGAKGGWRMLGALGAAAGIVSGLAIAIYHFLFAR
ncbi:MAG: hypothetical protein KGL35_25925 [Bradyrhizobium sp.]|nr:hypothetical protein [Bradyrhizobium sp.]HQT76830.1 hypothetical protein [Rhodopila sp.]